MMMMMMNDDDDDDAIDRREQIFGWQGVVPCKTEKMASRLVDIVTNRLLSIEEAFGRLDASQLASLLLPIVEAEIKEDCGGGRGGDMMVKVMHPFLPMILTRVISNLQIEIGDILDLRSVVLEAFMRDKVVLVELFQKVNEALPIHVGEGGGVELDCGDDLCAILNFALPLC
jgi:hypothetical protein